MKKKKMPKNSQPYHLIITSASDSRWHRRTGPLACGGAELTCPKKLIKIIAQKIQYKTLQKIMLHLKKPSFKYTYKTKMAKKILNIAQICLNSPASYACGWSHKQTKLQMNKYLIETIYYNHFALGFKSAY